MTNLEWMHNRLLERAGLSAKIRAPYQGYTFSQLVNLSWFPFIIERREKEAMAMGQLRYGDWRKKTYSIEYYTKVCCELHNLFIRSGNVAYLHDLRNFIAIEIINMQHPRGHYQPLDRVD